MLKKSSLALTLILLISLSALAQNNDIFTVIKKGSFKELSKHLKKNPLTAKTVDKEGKTPLQLAVRLKNNKMAKLLVKYGADPIRATGEYSMRTALYEALGAKNEEMVKWFYLNGVDINYTQTWPGRNGETYSDPFFYKIVRFGSSDLLKFMVKRGVDVVSRNSSGYSCFFQFSTVDLGPFYGSDKESKTMEKIDILFQAGADLDSQEPKGKTLLIRMISSPTKLMRSGRSDRINEAVKYFISKGVDLDIRDEEGWSAMHCAVWFNNKEVLKLLLDAGADPEAEHLHGETPIDFARNLKRKEMVNMMKKAGNVH